MGAVERPSIFIDIFCNIRVARITEGSLLKGKEPDSVSISDSGILYAKYGDELFVWLSEECPNSQVNNDGVCEDPSLSGGSIIAIVAGTVGGAVGLGVIGVIIYRKKKAKKESSLINSEDRTV